MTILISSFFIYQTKGSIESSSIERLGVILKVADQLKGREAISSSKLENSKPEFLWLVRDHHLLFKMPPKQEMWNLLENPARNSLTKCFSDYDCFPIPKRIFHFYFLYFYIFLLIFFYIFLFFYFLYFFIFLLFYFLFFIFYFLFFINFLFFIFYFLFLAVEDNMLSKVEEMSWSNLNPNFTEEYLVLERKIFDSVSKPFFLNGKIFIFFIIHYF